MQLTSPRLSSLPLLSSHQTRNNLQVRLRSSHSPFSVAARSIDLVPARHYLLLFPGTVIGVVEAEDADGDALRYYIGGGTINANNFDVNETTGELSFERPLDREVCWNYGARDINIVSQYCTAQPICTIILCRLLLPRMNHFCCLFESQTVWITTQMTHSKKSESFSGTLTITHHSSQTYHVLCNFLRYTFLVAACTFNSLKLWPFPLRGLCTTLLVHVLLCTIITFGTSLTL